MTRSEAIEEVNFVFRELRELMDETQRLSEELREARFSVSEGMRPQRSVRDIRRDQKCVRTRILAARSLSESLRFLVEIEGLEDDAEAEA